MRYILGIDPGANGGIAIWDNEQGLASVVKMPRDVMDIRILLQSYKEVDEEVLVFIEKINVWADDVEGQKNLGKMFRIQRMIQAYERLKACIEVEGVPYVMVHPMTWQTKLGLRVKGEEKHERKLRYVEVAGNFYPNIRTTLWNADALLIMRFGIIMLKTDLKWVQQNLPPVLYDKLF